ncbi:hypothetical protein FGO68_gene10615 [Halteria grandinella]|uniref:Uncharacterized protein n=1 Tax=Halteria grandinella TaxID=5974 RepID=A0A8J8NR84_HALGN|nr:hypothetical protein FGO68_gene10615 [Halteria grandinella]
MSQGPNNIINPADVSEILIDQPNDIEKSSNMVHPAYAHKDYQIQGYNLLQKHRYNNFKNSFRLLQFFLVVIVLNFFQNSALLIANFNDQEVIEEEFYWGFHVLDFGQSFAFAFVEAIVLIKCGVITFQTGGAFTTLRSIFSYAMLMINVGGTLVAFILFLFKAEFWEVPAHWIEYSVQCCVILTSFVFIFGSQDKTSVIYKYRYLEAVIITATLVFCIMKLFFYGEVIEVEMGGERAAHFFEYPGEMFNDVFAFLFTVIRIRDVHTQMLQCLSGSTSGILKLA